VVKIFANKVSGAKKNEEREEIMQLIEYVKTHEVDRVCCTEISRLGRSTIEALKVIEVLNDNKVNLFLANYGLETLTKDGKANPVVSLITTILLEISQLERGLIRDRMKAGYEAYRQRCKENGISIGRSKSYKKSEQAYREEYSKQLSLMRKNVSLRNISKLTGTSMNTLRKLKQYI
jgi:DNA invertase Pin-like site-specific DNA recombinase